MKLLFVRISALAASGVLFAMAPLSAASLFSTQSLGWGTADVTEKWTGLGVSSVPSNSGDLDSESGGVLPNSMHSNIALTKLSGGGYRAGQSIYWQSGSGGFSGSFASMLDIMNGTVTPADAAAMISAGEGLDGEGHFAISSTFDTPVALDSIAFQIQITGFGPAVADFENGTYISSYQLTLMVVSVTLTINGTTQITGTFENLYYGLYDSGQGAGTNEAEEIWGFRWDLSSVTGPIDSYTIEFANYPHASIRGLQTDVIFSAVPEPSSIALLAMGGGWLIWRRRKSSSQA